MQTDGIREDPILSTEWHFVHNSPATKDCQTTSQARLYVLELSLLSFVFAAATDCSTTALMAQASL